MHSVYRERLPLMILWAAAALWSFYFTKHDSVAFVLAIAVSAVGFFHGVVLLNGRKREARVHSEPEICAIAMVICRPSESEFLALQSPLFGGLMPPFRLLSNPRSDVLVCARALSETVVTPRRGGSVVLNEPFQFVWYGIPVGGYVVQGTREDFADLIVSGGFGAVGEHSVLGVNSLASGLACAALRAEREHSAALRAERKHGAIRRLSGAYVGANQYAPIRRQMGTPAIPVQKRKAVVSAGMARSAQERET